MGSYRPTEDKEGFAEYLACRPHVDDWDRPTAWLLGSQMLGSLGQLVLSTIHKGFDFRDWMTPEAGGVVLHDGTKARRPRPEDVTGDGNAYWLDFVADTGDAPALVYCLARAMQRDKLVFTRDDGSTSELPRGRLLVLGGDSAYPVADEGALRERWQAPLVWAHRASGAALPEKPIPVYAIPGNHDYYDALDGFNRQFRKQATADLTPSFKYPTSGPPLTLPGYTRSQSASYFALELPFDWHLWGVDLGAQPDESKPIDVRQQQYFRELHGGKAPAKLIVVTALPVAVHHAAAEAMKSPFEQLGLTRAFANKGELEHGHIRLDLSGDVHLYERYWGTNVAGDRLDGDNGKAATPVAEEQPNYAAVASGLGGAFHHPIQIRYGKKDERVTPARSWPAEKLSRKHIGDVLTRPRKVFQAGSIGIVGAALGVLFYLLSCASWGDGSGVLALPYLVWGRETSPAWDRLVDFGAVLLFLAIVGAGIYGLIRVRERSARLRNLMFERAPAKSLRDRLDTLLGGKNPASRRARLLRWTGANRRVMISVFLRSGWGAAWIAIVAAVAVLGWLLLRNTDDAGTNFAAALLVGGLIAFPFITNGHRLRRAAAFIPLGLLHGVAQLYAPQLWAGVTVQLVTPMLLLAGYWSLRPIASKFFKTHGRWLTLFWIVLVAAMLVGPMLLPRFAASPWTGTPLVAAVVCLVVGGIGTYLALDWVREGKWRRWRWLVLLAMIPVQVVTLLALPEVHTWTGSEAEWWLGLVAAAVAGAIFSCLWLGWYLLVCLQWGWHGNDAGSVARVDDWAEFLRIKLTRESAEVWAIAVSADRNEVEDAHDKKPTFAARTRLIDHFIVRAKGT